MVKGSGKCGTCGIEDRFMFMCRDNDPWRCAKCFNAHEEGRAQGGMVHGGTVREAESPDG